MNKPKMHDTILWLGNNIEGVKEYLMEYAKIPPISYTDAEIEHIEKANILIGHYENIFEVFDKYSKILAMANEPITTRDDGYQNAIVRLKMILNK